MKTSKLSKSIFKIFLAFTTAFGLMFTLNSCATLTPEQKAERAAQKELEARQKAAEHARVLEAFKNLNFVLEANRLTFRRGETANVSSAINFISVVNGKATVQLGSSRGMGLNGVGGITVEGDPSDVKFKTDKHGIVEMFMRVNGTGISAEVTISLYGDSNQASATIYPNLNSNKITLNGFMRPAKDSNTYKGTTL